jgi:hypothetical protein
VTTSQPGKAWELKDRSSKSFPGDHASVLLIWALFMSVFSRRLVQTWWSGGWRCCSCCRAWWPARTGAGRLHRRLLMAVLALGWSYYTPLAAKGSAADALDGAVVQTASYRWSGEWRCCAHS